MPHDWSLVKKSSALTIYACGPLVSFQLHRYIIRSGTAVSLPRPNFGHS